MKYFYITIIMMIAFPGIVFPNMIATEGSGSVLTVEVTNRTENGQSVIGDEVYVDIYHNQNQLLIDTLEGQVSEDGNAVFANVPVGEEVIALIQIKHQEMIFTGNPLQLSDIDENFTGQVDVFDVSTDQSKLSVQIHHIIMSLPLDNKTLDITEFLQLANSSDMAITSQERDSTNNAIVINISLPKGFKNLRPGNYFEAQSMVLTENGFYDTMAIPPGTYQATFSYSLDITSSTLDISKKISLPTSVCMVFLDGSAHLNGLNGAETQVMNRNDVSMEYLQFINLAKGQEIAFQINGLPIEKYKWMSWAIMSVVFFALIVFALMRSKPVNN